MDGGNPAFSEIMVTVFLGGKARKGYLCQYAQPTEEKGNSLVSNPKYILKFLKLDFLLLTISIFY